MTEEDPAETGPPPERPRLRWAGLIWTGAVLAGLVVLGLLGLAAITGTEDPSGDAFFFVILAGVGIWYVLPEFRANLARVRANRNPEE